MDDKTRARALSLGFNQKMATPSSSRAFDFSNWTRPPPREKRAKRGRKGDEHERAGLPMNNHKREREREKARTTLFVWRRRLLCDDARALYHRYSCPARESAGGGGRGVREREREIKSARNIASLPIFREG